MEELIAEHGLNNPRYVYENVKSADDLILTNISFLKGLISETPYYLDKINDETIPLLDKLIKINSFGFISVGGQPALINDNLEQKSYIHGYLPKKYMNVFDKYFEKQSVYYLIMDCQKPTEQIFDNGYKIINCDTLINNFIVDYYNLTKVKYYEYANEYYDCSDRNMPLDATVIWSNLTNINAFEPDNHLHSFKKYDNIINILKDYVFIDIACFEYGTGSVEDILLDFFLKF